MKRNKWLIVCLGLTLAGLMAWVGPGFAQGRGQNQWGSGYGPCGQVAGWGQGQGLGYGNCPDNSGYQYCPRSSGDNPQATMGRRGARGAGRNYQPNTQNYVPPVTQ